MLIHAQVLQWFWFGTKADQTYESCVDIVVPGQNSIGFFSANNGVNILSKMSDLMQQLTNRLY
jgi:hypothetical protein